MSVTVGTWRRYSWRAVSRPAKPRCQPSIIASENAHTQDVAHVANVSARHGSRCAMDGPHSTAAMPMTIAGTVPHPTWAFHHPKIGAVPAKILKRSGVLLISGVTMPRCRCGTTNAATTRAAPRATAIASLRPTFTPASLLPTRPRPSPLPFPILPRASPFLPRASPLLAASFPLLAASARVCSATRRCSPGFCGCSQPATVRKMPLVTATGRRRARKSSARPR